MLRTDHKLALFMEGALGEDTGKMGLAVLRYSPNPVACVIDSCHVGADLRGLVKVDRSPPIVGTVREAAALGAEVLVLGIAPPGGLIPERWWACIDEAVELGLSVVNGLHDHLAERYRDLREEQWVWDVRVEPKGLKPGEGLARTLSNRRVLMVGTDMSVGKMTSGLEVHFEMLRRGVKSAFVATGQVGITVMGSGVPLDAVRLDFASGAIEREVMAARDADVVVVEGQGALLHPGSSATLPLMRGTIPTDLIMCTRANQPTLRRVPWVRVPNLKEYIALYENLASTLGTFPSPKTLGLCVITASLEEGAALDECKRIEDETGLPAVDPIRHGVSKLVDSLLGTPPALRPVS